MYVLMYVCMYVCTYVCGGMLICNFILFQIVFIPTWLLLITFEVGTALYSCFKLVSHRLSSDQSRNFLSSIVLVMSLFVMATCLLLFTVSHLVGRERMGRRKERWRERRGEGGEVEREGGEGGEVEREEGGREGRWRERRGEGGEVEREEGKK